MKLLITYGLRKFKESMYFVSKHVMQIKYSFAFQEHPYKRTYSRSEKVIELVFTKM